MGMLKDITDDIKEVFNIQSDFSDGYDDVKDITKDTLKSIIRPSTISRRAKSGIMQFPVLVSTSLSIENASMVSKALEREYVSFIRILTSLNSVTDAKSIQKYLKKFHVNIGSEWANEATQLIGMENKFFSNNFSEAFNNFTKTTEDNLVGLLENDNYLTEDVCVIPYRELPTSIKLENLTYLKENYGDVHHKFFRSADTNGIFILNDKDELSEALFIQDEKGKYRLLESECFVNGSRLNINNIEMELVAENAECLGSYTDDFNIHSLNELSSPSKIIVNGKILNEGKHGKKDGFSERVADAFVRNHMGANYGHIGRGREEDFNTKMNRSIVSNIDNTQLNDFKEALKKNDKTKDLNFDVNDMEKSTSELIKALDIDIKGKSSEEIEAEINKALGVNSSDYKRHRDAAAKDDKTTVQSAISKKITTDEDDDDDDDGEPSIIGGLDGPVGHKIHVDRASMVPDNNLMDNDVKKANEMVPTMLHLRTFFKNKENTLQSVDYIIGVKTIIHPISSESMIRNLDKANLKSRGLFRLMKLTSGEISFFKDFIFSLDTIKDELKTRYKDNKWFSVLMSRKRQARLFTMNNNNIPNTTIVISQDEANILKEQYSMDVENLSNVKHICSVYNLLGFVIVDPSSEVCKFYFDGDMDFAQQSFTSLERENSNSAREMKNMMQIIGRL